MSAFDVYIKSKPAISGNITHTRIGDDKNKFGEGVIYGGAYTITDDNMNTFYEKYYNKVFENKENEYMTEKQLIEDGPILIDIDLRYNSSVSKKIHTKDHKIDLIGLYGEKITELVDIKKGDKLDIYVMEKNSVNILEGMTKDGIHIIIGMKMHKGLQVMLRKRVLQEIQNLWKDIPIINNWEDVLDEGITKGFCNWQMYGSKKPGHQPYLLKEHFTITFDGNIWEILENTENNVFDTKKNFKQLTARNNTHPSFNIRDEVKEEYANECLLLNKKSSTSSNASVGGNNEKKYKKISKPLNQVISYGNINSEEILDNLLDDLFSNLNNIDYKLKETHDYTMCLPNSYYGAGSFNKWIRVGWALANTDHKLFLTWLKFSSQDNCRKTLSRADGKFDWKNVPEMYKEWCSFNSNNTDGLTFRSIMYWAKQDSYQEYEKIRKNTIDYYIEKSVIDSNDYNLAVVLYQMYKDKFVCVSVKQNSWYKFENNRWVDCNNGPADLHLKLSTDMKNLYVIKAIEYTNKLALMSEEDENKTEIKKITSKFAELTKKTLMNNTPKNKILNEAKNIFYVENFMEKLDTKPYLLCFNNYVVDFETNTYRKGQPTDYISKSTNIDYVPLCEKKHSKTIEEINSFMCQLFPNEILRNYMWEHLASCLVGTNDNQTFNIYTGSGANGKSKLVDLMTKSLGSYKETVPITLITGKRNNIGSTSSEIVNLKGARYAVIQEPSKNEQLNEGIMKEITGGDPIQGRALYKDVVTFTPQFKLIVCTNSMFDIKSNDDGTWRRIRVNDFTSKFLETPFGDPRFSREDYPYQFKIDKKINNKFDEWAPIFMSMLVQISFKNKGIVNDCDIVLSSSNTYRNGQDYLSEFIKDRIIKKEGGRIKKTELSQEFKNWYTTNIGKNMPKTKELFEFMEKRFGKCRPDGWKNIEINYDDNESENDVNEE